jgi:putative FmdB family regulatory protein
VPTYQYACTACGEQLEAVQSFTDAALTDCPACGGALRKVFSAVGVVFKGSGFYKNDSRTSTSSDSKTDSKTDSKPDAAPKKDAPAAASTSTASTASTASTPAAKTA